MESSSRTIPHRKFASVGEYGQLPVIPAQSGATDREAGAVRKMSTSRCISDTSPVSPPSLLSTTSASRRWCYVRLLNRTTPSPRYRRLSPARPQHVRQSGRSSYSNYPALGNTAITDTRERKLSLSTSVGTRRRKISSSSTHSDLTLYSSAKNQSRRNDVSDSEPSTKSQTGYAHLAQGLQRIIVSKRVARNFRQRVHEQIVDRKGRGILAFAQRPRGRESVLKTVTIEPTYQLEPVDKFSLYHHRILSIMNEQLCLFLDGERYNGRKCARQAQFLSVRIKDEVKALGLDRYKVITVVTIGENIGQSLQVSSRAVWDTLTDSFVSTNFQNSTLFCIAKVFAVYCE
ncbi:putative tctex1 domain-containing protein 1-B-like [Apostichopus japonicus]|uniref:Putative tctex1 domain-containing protein 1-B-like n=1 Tax=Stichopus japonicus TaxID=307972 RepID=A0A2G8JYU7_STIJA|nr:putative tctex1 domain-containing protein 1-B-like [Apostichopus japonicus]